MKKLYVALLLPMIKLNVSAFSQMQIEGRYAYEHNWSYNIDTAHLDVYETGFINFYEDGTALDEARHVFVITHNDNRKDTHNLRYASPSRWRADDEHLWGLLFIRLRARVSDTPVLYLPDIPHISM